MISNEKNKNGFTLIELMIVMVIMGVLATIGIGSFISSQKKSRDTKRKVELQQIAKAMELYYNDFGKYPAHDAANGQIKGCGASTSPTSCVWGEAFAHSTGPTYMIKLPKDPGYPTRTYSYKKINDKTYYLYAQLENDQDEGEGVNQSGYTSAICPGCTIDYTYAVASLNAMPQ